MTTSQQSALTDRDRETMAKAGKLAAARSVREYTGEADILTALVAAISEAQHLLAEQALIIKRLTGDQ
jgi:hypothetical protein